jgi:hypothetical protein
MFDDIYLKRNLLSNADMWQSDNILYTLFLKMFVYHYYSGRY